MEFRMLGPLEVTSDGRVVELGPRKQRAVLAVLLLHSGEIVPTDRLIEEVWGEHPPKTPAHSVQIYVSELRKVLEMPGQAPLIETRSPGYMLHADPEAIDAGRFERLVAEARDRSQAHDLGGTVRSLRSALHLWRGPPLSDFVYEEFARADIQHLTGLHLDAFELLAGAEFELGHAQEALAIVEAGIAEDPLRERFRELQMLCLYRLGRHAEALRAFQEFQATLVEELGLDPSPALRHVQERILLHDPTLTPAERPPGGVEVRNPYKGLRAFEERDVEDFFGRGRLVEELIQAVTAARFVSLVGPSGCGKSSVVGAGLIPALRGGAIQGSERWAIAKVVLGTHPLQQLEEALAQIGPPGVLFLVVDQFEQVFSTGAEEQERRRFLDLVCSTLEDPEREVHIVVTLRADFYDRPLQHPTIAAPFAANVVNVLPMTAEELEDAVVRPASMVGVTVEPALLAELVAEATGRPGALPLLQFSLTELFDRRAGSELTVEAYRSLGGLRGLVSRRSETLFEGLSEDGRQTCVQVFLRLVRIGAGTRDARRRTPLRELSALGLDPVALSDVLETFGRHRLLTFDRDPSTGEATIELAHEALLWEWGRLAGWIEQHREDLRRLDSLARAAEAWEGAGRDPDYLIAGSQLADFEGWSRVTALQLAARERGFLDAALERRREQERAQETARASQRRLERRARSRLGELISLLSEGRVAGPEVVRRAPDVALIWEGFGDGGWNDAIGTGFDRATEELDLHAELRVVALSSRDPLVPELRRLSEIGVGLIVVGSALLDLGGMEAIAAEHPECRYVASDVEGHLSNVTYLMLHEEQGSFLAGAAAALRSQTGIVGFIGGSRKPLIRRFAAGYEAGARAVRPQTEVRTVYLYQGSLRLLQGYADTRKASSAADDLYRDGADVIFTAAGSSGYGTVHAAHRRSEELGRHLWAIGVDADQHEALAAIPDLPDEVKQAWRAHSLTSMVKRYDLVFSAVLRDYVAGTLVGGPREFGLAGGATDITYSGGFIDDLRPVIEDLRARIVSGEIQVPSRPERRRDIAPRVEPA